MKYYLLQHGDGADENTLHAFDTPAERDEATIKAIFGEDITTQDEAEAWDKYREELNDRGHVTFEGDPGLQWFTATPAESREWHMLSSIRIGAQLTELLAATSEDGIGVMARWMRREDGGWDVSAVDTESGDMTPVTDFHEGECVPPTPPLLNK